MTSPFKTEKKPGWRLTPAGAWVFTNPEGDDVANVFRHFSVWTAMVWESKIESSHLTYEEAKLWVEQKLAKAEQMAELQTRFNLTDDELTNVLAWLNEEDDLDSGAEEKLYSFYMDSGEMPYGVAKARDGDPQQWIFKQLQEDVDWS